jgi:exopolysaccharide production protein ExoQ
LAKIKENKTEYYLFIFLLLFFAIRIATYYTLFPDNIILTRAIKVGGRLLMTCIAIFIFLKFSNTWKHISFKFIMVTPFVLYCAYLFLGFLSISWSTNPSFSILQLAMTLETFLFSFIFYKVCLYFDGAYNRKIPVIVSLLSRAVFIHSLWFIVGSILDPDFYYRTTHGGTVARLGGLIINPNELGLLSLMGIGCAYIELLNNKNKKFQIVNILTMITVLLMTQSRSSLISFFILSAIYLFLTNNYYIKFSAIIIAILVTPILFNTIIIKDGDFEEVASFTGRKEFWADLVNEGFPERPILGRGFMSIAENKWNNNYESTHSYTASMCHNTYVEVLTNLGLVGAFICLLQLLVTITAIILNRNRILRVTAVFMLFPLLLNSITEFGIFGHNNYAILFYQLVFLFFTLSYKRKNTVPVSDKLNLEVLAQS